MRQGECGQEEAERCRRLADAILNKDDPTKIALLALAVEFDQKATASEAEVKAALISSTGNTIRK